jgi:hypothetical protein
MIAVSTAYPLAQKPCSMLAVPMSASFNKLIQPPSLSVELLS